MPKTYDGDINTGCAFKGGMSCMSEWSWKTPVTVNAINIHSKNYHKDNYIYGVWGYSNGSWIEIWSGKLHLPSDSWYSHVIEPCPNCTAIWLMQSHAKGAITPKINDINISHESVQLLPEGDAGKVINFVKQPDGSYIEADGVSGKVVGDVIVCSDYITESTCIAACCYWYNGACHTKPEEEEEEEAEIPWLLILAAVVGAISIIVLAHRR